MKKIFILVLFISGIVAVYEQSQERPNLYVCCLAFVIFMLSMMQLSSKITSKNNDGDKI